MDVLKGIIHVRYLESISTLVTHDNFVLYLLIILNQKKRLHYTPEILILGKKSHYQNSPQERKLFSKLSSNMNVVV